MKTPALVFEGHEQAAGAAKDVAELDAAVTHLWQEGEGQEQRS